MLPDLIVAWPMHMDYPIWRQQIREHRRRFRSVFIVFTNMNVLEHNYRSFVRESMVDDNISFMNCPPVEGGQDWRHVAVTHALRSSRSRWVFFTEQDFFWKEGFWDNIEEARTNYIATVIQGRVHPCCIFISRDLLNTTNKNFGVVPNVSDHFSMIQNDLSKKDIHEIPQQYWEHIGGLSQNLYFLQKGELENISYNVPAFRKFCEDSLKVTVPLHDDFRKWFNEYLQNS